MRLPLVRPVQRLCGTPGQDGNIAAHPTQPGAAGIWQEVLLHFLLQLFFKSTLLKGFIMGKTLNIAMITMLSIGIMGCDSVRDTIVGTETYDAYLAAINAERAHPNDCGDTHYEATTELVWNDQLAAAARKHSKDMAHNDFMSHVSSDGTIFKVRIQNEGYTSYDKIGENVAAGQESVSVVVAEWMESPGHCKNIMDPRFDEMGMALEKNSAGTWKRYWTLDLGGQ